MFRHLISATFFFVLLSITGTDPCVASEEARLVFPDGAALIQSAREKRLSSETGALILRCERQLYAGKQGDIELKVYVCALLSDEKAASDYSQISIHYNSYFETIGLDFARSIQENGERLNASKDAIQTRTVSQMFQAKMYSDMKTLTFSIPALRPGSAFEFMVTRKIKPIVGQSWAKRLDFNFTLYHSNPVPRVDPVLESRLTVVSPGEEKIKFHVHNASVKPQVARSKDGLAHTWVMESVPKLVYESNMPVDDYLLPAVEVSSLKDWEEVDRWAHELFSANMVPSEAIRKTTGEITAGIPDRVRKIQVVFEYIQKNIEYIEADLNRGGYAPHSADQILKNKYGDCKDQTVLFVSMLKALGIEAYPALLTTFPGMENRMEIPTPYFNHAITYIPHDDGDLWLDTVAISKFPNLLFPSQGRNAFVVNGRGGVFKKTPFSGNESSEGEMQVLIKISGETLSVEMNLLAKGALGDIYKNALKAMALEQRKTMAQDLLKGMYPASEIENVTFSNFSDPNAAFKMSTRCRIPYAIPSTSQILQLPFSPMASIAFFSTLTKLSPPADRKTDYITGFGFDIKSQWTYDMTESGFASANLPDAEIMDSEFLRFERRFFEQGRTLRGTSNLTLKTSNVPLEKYSAFYQETLKILQNGHKVLSFQKREVDHAALALETSLKDHPDDVSNILGLAKQYLKSGKYAQANALLGRAVALDPKNGESHYLMGIALGHEYKMEEARKEFEAASRLGYLP